MDAYLVETLLVNGWRRSNLLHFRYQDAHRHALLILDEQGVRAVRVLPVNITDRPVFWQERNDYCVQASDE